MTTYFYSNEVFLIIHMFAIEFLIEIDSLNLERGWNKESIFCIMEKSFAFSMIQQALRAGFILIQNRRRENQVERLVGEKKQMEALIKKAYEIIEEFHE